MVKGKVAMQACQIKKVARAVASTPGVRAVVEAPEVWVANTVVAAAVGMDQAGHTLKMDRVVNLRILNLKYRISLLLHPGSKSNALPEDIN